MSFTMTRNVEVNSIDPTGELLVEIREVSYEVKVESITIVEDGKATAYVSRTNHAAGEGTYSNHDFTYTLLQPLLIQAEQYIATLPDFSVSIED